MLGGGKLLETVLGESVCFCVFDGLRKSDFRASCLTSDLPGQDSPSLHRFPLDCVPTL